MDRTYAEDGHSGFCCEEQERREKVNETGSLSSSPLDLNSGHPSLWGEPRHSLWSRDKCVMPVLVLTFTVTLREALKGIVGLTLSLHLNLRPLP